MDFAPRALILTAGLLIAVWAKEPSHAQQKPTVFIIGDSTVKTGSGEGEGGMWGWGAFLSEHFDLDRINVENHALGGRSSRTFQTEGLWADVLKRVKPDDYVVMQFGHNDGIEPDNPRRGRAAADHLHARLEPQLQLHLNPEVDGREGYP